MVTWLVRVASDDGKYDVDVALQVVNGSDDTGRTNDCDDHSGDAVDDDDSNSDEEENKLMMKNYHYN